MITINTKYASTDVDKVIQEIEAMGFTVATIEEEDVDYESDVNRPFPQNLSPHDWSTESEWTALMKFREQLFTHPKNVIQMERKIAIMSTIEHLKAIKAKCTELLEVQCLGDNDLFIRSSLKSTITSIDGFLYIQYNCNPCEQAVAWAYESMKVIQAAWPQEQLK